MDINFNKLMEIYGINIINCIGEESENLLINIKYLLKLGFQNIEDIIELYPYLFILDNVEFTEKVNSLIKKIGINYIELLNTNTELWGYLDD